MSQYLILLQQKRTDVHREAKIGDTYESLAMIHAASATTAIDTAFANHSDHVIAAGYVLASATDHPQFKFIAIGIQSKRASIQTRPAPIPVPV